MTLSDQDFNALWNALLEPVKALEARVAAMSRQAPRAEVTGAVELVDALPSAGAAGRIIMLSTNHRLYYDTGSAWIMVGGVTMTTRSVVLPSNFASNSTTFVDITGSGVSHTFTRANALIQCSYVAHGNTTTTVEIRVKAGTVTGTTIGGIFYNVPQGGMVADVLNVSGLSGSQTINLQMRSNGGQSCTMYVRGTLVYTIVEFD